MLRAVSSAACCSSNQTLEGDRARSTTIRGTREVVCCRCKRRRCCRRDKVPTPGADGTGRVEADKGRARGRKRGKKAGGGSVVPPMVWPKRWVPLGLIDSGGLGVALPRAYAKRSRLLPEVFGDCSYVGRAEAWRSGHDFPNEWLRGGNCRVQGLEFYRVGVGRQDKVRPLCRQFYQGTNGLIYVVKSRDRNTVVGVKEELNKIFEEKMRDAVVLAFANALTPSTATRSGKNLTDVQKTGDFWWCDPGATPGCSVWCWTWSS